MSVREVTSASQSGSATERLRLFEMRLSMSPFTRSSGRSERPAQSLSRSARMRGTSKAISSRAMRKHAPMPTIWCVGNVPLRIEPHLTPYVQRADAFGPVCLVRGEGHEIDGQTREIDLHLAGRLRGV